STSVLFFFQAEDGIRDFHVTGVQTCALPISPLLRRERLPLRRTPSWPEPGVPPGGGGADRQPLPRGRRGGGGLGQPPAGGAGARSEERRVGLGGVALWSRAEYRRVDKTERAR